MRVRRPAILAACLIGALAARPSRADDSSAVEFFEKEIRPILAGRCQTCHGAERSKNGLRLDSRAAALAGGLSGPAVVPGEPAESLLVEAISYGDFLQMPPKSKLPEAEIAALTKWVEMGAPWPGGDAAVAASPEVEAFDLTARAARWSFQPIAKVETPEVRDASWPLDPLDRFLLARLESEGLSPSPQADRRTLIRRVTFDLTGLPPTAEEVEAFVQDGSPDAYEKRVDRLLASPQHGERWGRHWLDLVRFAESAGHEFDYDILNAWRYRDYVVRAINADVPYDQFVVEHLAGDLLDEPRRHPIEGFNESILGTGFFALGEGTHSPVDVREEQLRRIDNQIDVLSKTFLGLTVACARCHDHKFDPIRQADYSALAGFLKSSRHQQAFLDPGGRIAAKAAELRRLKAEAGRPFGAVDADRIASYAEAAWRAAHQAGPIDAGSAGLKADVLARWTEVLRDPSSGAMFAALVRDHDAECCAVETLADPCLGGCGLVFETTADARGSRGLEDETTATQFKVEDGSDVFADFDGPELDGWTTTGQAFGDRPTAPGDWRPGASGPRPVGAGWAHSGLVSDRLEGVLRSPTFTIEQPYILYHVEGHGGRLNLVIDGFEKIRSPIYGGLTVPIEADRPSWIVQDVSMWVGHRAYVELADGGVVDFTGATSRLVSGDGFVALDEVRFAPSPTPPADLSGGPIDDPSAWASRLGRAAAEALDAWRAGRLGPEESRRVEALGWLVGQGLIGEPAPGALDPLRAAEADLPAPVHAPALCDGDGEDEFLLLRGDAHRPGDPVPRRGLEVFGGLDEPAPKSGSGRLALARRLTDPEVNPLPARVMVNRIWLHHFGRGLVATPDDFGRMGQPPSHPDLLDDLALEFINSGWSVKAMHRRIVLSRAYRMSSRPDDFEAERRDPDNHLFHRMNVRRLEAESIRDAMLAVSGRLDRRLGGPSVPPHLTPFMDGRGRPSHSGPLDGDGRRSLYINIRRNFLPPMLLAFDYPPPATTMGRRNVSNVPAQALTLLDDPFVLEQARIWADRVRASPGTDAEKVDRMFLDAFGRSPNESEREQALAFLGDGGPSAWAELAHVLLNVKEFLFVD